MIYRYRLRPYEWLTGLAVIGLAGVVFGNAALASFNSGATLLGIFYTLAWGLISVAMLVTPMRFPDVEVQSEGLVIRYPFRSAQLVRWVDITQVEEDRYGLKPGRVKPLLRVHYRQPETVDRERVFTISPQITRYEELRERLSVIRNA